MSRMEIVSIFLAQSYVEVMRGQARLSQGYVEHKLALGRGVRRDIICFDLSIITMVISAGLALG